MSRSFVQFEGTAGGLVLSSAILLYRSESLGGVMAHGARQAPTEAFASIHAVEHDDAGHPAIGVGTPLTRAHLRQWAEALDRTAKPEILPANVLVAHHDMIAWWTPAQVRSGYFALTSPSGLRTLSEQKIVAVPYPAHLFIATRSGLGVYALPTSERPSADTPVLHSPILNIFIEGQLCWGNIARPKAPTIAAIPDYERAVFDSWSTHLNIGQEHSVTGKGGLVRLWDDLATRAARKFPVKRLKPFNPRARSQNSKTERGPDITVGQLIAAQSR